MIEETNPPVISNEDRIAIFKLATKGLVHWHHEKFKAGMTYNELKKALEDALGIFGGSGGPKQLSVSHKGAGLCIWGGWHSINHVKDKPLYSGAATIAMAREVYGIIDPDSDQLPLL